MPKGQSLQERFEARVDKESSDCWLWTGTTDKDGYGIIWTKEKNNNDRAHRVSLKLAGVVVPDHMYVLHSCDNPTCVNPSHLSVGDNRQNQIEARDRGLLGDLTSKREKYYLSMTDEEFVEWEKRFEGKVGKETANRSFARNVRKRHGRF